MATKKLSAHIFSIFTVECKKKVSVVLCCLSCTAEERANSSQEVNWGQTDLRLVSVRASNRLKLLDLCSETFRYVAVSGLSSTGKTLQPHSSYYWVSFFSFHFFFCQAKWGYILSLVFRESPRCVAANISGKALQLKGALTLRHCFITTTVYISRYILSISIIKFGQIICLGFKVVCHWNMIPPLILLLPNQTSRNQFQQER